MSANASLFERLLGVEIATLPAPLRQIHDGRARGVWSGLCEVERGRHWLAGIMARIASLPPSGTGVPITVTISASEDREVWERNFGGHIMRSTLIAENAYLSERLGPIKLIFELRIVGGAIEWRLHAVRYLGLPLPVSLFSATHARESLVESRYGFDVRVSLPIVGLLIRYRGWLAENDNTKAG